MKSFLTDLQRQQLKTQHKRERDKRICDRIKAVLLYDKGWSRQQIAEALLLSEETVRIHINEFQSSCKLKPENGGTFSKLSDQETQKILGHLEKHTYLYVKDIISYVKLQFNVLYTVSGMNNWLKAHGFSYKKPAIIPGKVNVQAQKEWIEEFKKLKANLPQNDSICFIDGVHPTHNTKPTYGWIKRGVRKEIPTNSGRQRINISGAVDIVTKKVVYSEDYTLNADSTITFLKKLEESYPESNRVHVFCDNARYYKNKMVKQYLENSKITLHFLPSYSPNLNPIERLWKLMYEHVLYNKYYEKYCDFKKAVFGFLDNLTKPKNKFLPVLTNRITDNFQVIGTIS